MRSIDELISEEDAWPAVSAAVSDSNGRCVTLPAHDAGGRCLHALQVTTRSVLGAVAFHCGGLLVDHGWVRLFGAGSGPLPSLAAANDLRGEVRASPPMMLVGVDVLGGKFAINGGALQGELGDVNFWGPETLSWETLGVGYGQFVYWLIDGATTELYSMLRWPNWEAESDAVGLDHALMLYPPPCTQEGKDVSKASRRAVPRAEFDAWLVLLAVMPEGGPFKIIVEP